MDISGMIQNLEATGDYKVFRNLHGEISVYNQKNGNGKLHKVCIIDTETTGLDTTSCEVIELGYKIIEFDSNGLFYNVVASKDFFQEPSEPITEEITKITGITNEDVAGKSIPWDEVEQDMSDISLFLAHNAAYDRKVLERYNDMFKSKIWACSVVQVPWDEVAGVHSRSQEFLCFKYANFVYNAHRAVDDVEALSLLLSTPNANNETPFSFLLKEVRKVSHRVDAVNAPFAVKDDLKANGFSWDQVKRVWTIVVEDAKLKDTLEFLNELGCKSPTVNKVKGVDRFSVRDA